MSYTSYSSGCVRPTSRAPRARAPKLLPFERKLPKSSEAFNILLETVITVSLLDQNTRRHPRQSISATPRKGTRKQKKRKHRNPSTVPPGGDGNSPETHMSFISLIYSKLNFINLIFKECLLFMPHQ